MVKPRLSQIAIIAFIVVVASLALHAHAQLLPMCPMPYKRLDIGAPVYSLYFDGSKLWVVYPSGDKTAIALYLLTPTGFVEQWVSSLPGTPAATAVDNDLTLLAVATKAHKIAVFDIHGKPILYIERGVRSTPKYVGIVNVSRTYALLAIEEYGTSSYWVYAYSLNSTTPPAELWLPIPGALGAARYKVVPVYTAGEQQPQPEIAIVEVKTTQCYYPQLNRSYEADAIVVKIYKLVSIGGLLYFVPGESFNATPGCEIGRSPYLIQSIDYAVVYYSPLDHRLFAAIGVTMTQRYVPGLNDTQLPGSIYAFLLVDSATNTSLVRYEDAYVGTLDYYPLGGKMTAFAATRDNHYVAVGSSDYNVRVFERSIATGYYNMLYSISLAGPVSVLVASPYAQVIIAASSNGQMAAIHGPTGKIYWSLPVGSAATVASIYSGYAAIGTQSGTIFAFTNPRVKLYYLGIRINATSIANETYVLSSWTTVTIRGVYQSCLVYRTINKTLEYFAKNIYFELLPSTTYTVKVDNAILGTVEYIIPLTSNVVYTIQPSQFRIPRYHVHICLVDRLREKPPVAQGAYLNITRLASPEPGSTIIAQWSIPLPKNGCLDLLLDRGYYYFTLWSWRYHPEIVINGSETGVLRVWRNMTIIGYVTPYLADSVVIHVETDYGLPLSGANVTLYDPYSGLRYTRVSGAGVVKFTSIPYGNYTVVVTYPYAEKATTILNLASPSAELTVTLKPKSYFVTIRVVDAETGAPVQPFTYRIVRPFDGFTLSGTVTKHNYVILRLVYGTYTISVEAPGYQQRSYAAITVTSDMMITFKLPPIYYTVTFIVKDILYQRQLPAKLVITNPETGATFRLNALNGAAQLQLRAGTYIVKVYSPYAYPAVFNITIASSRTVTLPVEPRNYTLVVIPVDAEAKLPIAKLGYSAGGYVYCVDTGNWTLRWVAKRGALEAIIPYSTGCTLTVYSRLYSRYTASIGAIDANKTIKALLAPIKTSLTINVQSSYGVPVAFNATVKGGPLNETYHISGTGTATVMVRPGTYHVHIVAAYHQPYDATLTVNLTPATLRVTLKPIVYPVEVIVLDAQTGMGVRRAVITVERVAPVRSKPFTVIAQVGSTTIPLTWGTYILTVAAPGYQEASTRITVPLQLNVTLALQPLTYKVVFRVVDALTEKPLPGANITLVGIESRVTLLLRTGRDGTAKAELRVDTYRVLVSARNHQPYSTTIRVEKSAAYTFKLAPINYTVTLRAYDALTKQPLHEKWEVIVTSLTNRKYTLKLTATTPTLTFQLPTGEYAIEVIAQKYMKVTIKRLLVNHSVSKNIYLPRMTYQVTIKVIDTRGAPVPNAIVTAYCFDAKQVVTTSVTDNQGEVTTKLPWCKYRISVEAGGYFPRSIIVTINRNGQIIPIMIKPTLSKIVLDLLPAIIIASAVVGTGVWVGIRVKRKPAGAELLSEIGEEEE